MSASVAVDCIEELEKMVGAISELRGKVFHVSSEEDLMEKTKGIAFPCAGIVYGGMRSVPKKGETHDLGLSAELTASLLIGFKESKDAKAHMKDTAITVLDKVRAAIRGKRSASGHFWKFNMEAPIEGKSGVLYYFQRWSCPVQLT